MSSLSIRQRMLIFIVVLAILATAAVLIWLMLDRQGTPLGVYDHIAPFALEEVQTGERYHSDNGLIKLLSFIFINCPDGVCPMTMQDYGEIQEKLKKEGLFGTRVELIAITFDPERDTTEALKSYAETFKADPSGWRFLRGTPEEIKAVADDLKYFYNIAEDGTGMHATTHYIIDGSHQVRAYHKMSTVSERMDQQKIMQDLIRLAKERQ